MTFLEFVAERLMGPPVSGSNWHCPFCASRRTSLSVRPPLDGYAIKFKCHRCAMWGDEFDLVKEFYPGEDYPRRRVRLDQWRKDWERDAQHEDSITRGPGSLDESENIALALVEFLAFLREATPVYAEGHLEGFRTLAFAQSICDEAGVQLSMLAAECAQELIDVRKRRRAKKHKGPKIVRRNGR